MSWNWQLPNWPRFTYDISSLHEKEKQFLLNAGKSFAYLKSTGEQEYEQYIVEILGSEGQESSRIEGELLDRESLQSSIKRQFGLPTQGVRELARESGMAKLLYDVYTSSEEPLTHAMVGQWHEALFKNSHHIESRGCYRTHAEPMQIVSHRYGSNKLFFEAPPSVNVPKEMDSFIRWFNSESQPPSILGKAAIAHVYFESIHPFEDGNGRIGRALVEKSLSRGVGKPILIATSKVLEKNKKAYYKALEQCNRTLEVTPWVVFFADMILKAQEEATKLLSFLLAKSTLLSKLSGKVNERQEKVLLRIFQEGPEGFDGGLSADNYISITKTSRATATRDLSELVQLGALVKTGELRHTRYWLNVHF